MIFASLALAAPVVVTLDNGGFNLPLYTPRWNGEFERPSVAQTVMAAIARQQSKEPRVFTYLPPGRRAGSSSTPTEIAPEVGCAPGDNCWDALDVNRSPTASTSLYQAVAGVRSKVPGPRLEVHFTDLFEEDPSTSKNRADADRCVTLASTRKAVEAVLSEPADHIVVGRLRAQVDAPRRSSGGLVAFRGSDDACWSGKRLRTFGGDGRVAEVDMAVVILGVGTAIDDDFVQRFVRDLPRQISEPLSLELVVVREPATIGEMAPQYLDARTGDLFLPPAIPRQTPCDRVSASSQLWSGGQSLNGVVQAACDDAALLHFPHEELSRSFRSQAGLNPLVGSMEIAGEVVLRGDVEAPKRAWETLIADRAADRPLPFFAALTESLRFGEDVVSRPRIHRVRLDLLTVSRIDDRPWLLSFLVGLLPFILVSLISYLILARLAGNRAFRRHLEAASAEGRPVAAVLMEAAEEARAGWFPRLMVALFFAALVAMACMLGVLFLDGVSQW